MCKIFSTFQIRQKKKKKKDYSSMKNTMHIADIYFMFLTFRPGQHKGLCTVFLQTQCVCCCFFLKRNCFCSVSAARQWVVGRYEHSRHLCGNQLSLFITRGCKTFRMRSLFVRAAGISLYCKTHNTKVNKKAVSFKISIFFKPTLKNLLPYWVNWGLH